MAENAETAAAPVKGTGLLDPNDDATLKVIAKGVADYCNEHKDKPIVVRHEAVVKYEGPSWGDRLADVGWTCVGAAAAFGLLYGICWALAPSEEAGTGE